VSPPKVQALQIHKLIHQLYFLHNAAKNKIIYILAF
jgi:hypothetical protein